MDPYKYLNIRLNPDGSLTRNGEAKLLPPCPSGEPIAVTAAAGADGPAHRIVHSNDAPLNDANGTSIRLFIPGNDVGARDGSRLPLILYFHGGGYVLFRAASEPFHNTAATIAATVPAAVASVDYRLAPEHRLPAAFDDAADAVRWVRSYAAGSPGRPIFIMGSHSGASIAFRAALAAVDQGVELRGLILNQAHHSGVERTAAEQASVDDRVLPLPANDLLWELALPLGADRDHEYCNPDAMLAGISAARLRRLPPCLVLGRKKDPPRDRQRFLVAALREAGVHVEARMDGAGFHAMELFKANCAAEFNAQVADFVRRHAHAGDGVDEHVARSRL
ncbi:probable carboxylesterase 8 [Lolium rigidum]|uniref:probable carboxylesterase 8 n=1 Tax=Lolium rigidum TaxID=89674 RepID=UPI001F5C1F0C|nr:probable carboxylesterase 8 [Lolium rigidum]